MPSLQQFNVNAQADVTPNGTGAQMSKSGANNQPNQAQWHCASVETTIKLPSAVWQVTPNDGSAFAFTMPPNSTSATYTLKPTAPVGPQIYAVETKPGLEGGNTTPSIIVNP